MVILSGKWLSATSHFFFLMEEVLRLLRENNLMLRAICQYIAEHSKDGSEEDIKDFVTNIIANIYANNRFNVR